MCIRSSLPAFAALILLAGCGSGGSKAAPHHPVTERTSGQGGHQIWRFEASGAKPKAVVVFIHGLGGRSEDTPVNHEPWLRHLAAHGNVVLYPRYEKQPGDSKALRNLFETVPAAVAKVRPKHLPLVVIGYSRGGGLAVDYTALQTRSGTPEAVLDVFPILLEQIDPKLDLRSIPPRVNFVFLVGDKDTTVGAGGTLALLRQFDAAGYPRVLLHPEIVHSHGSFKATHLSPLENTPGARKAFWARADRLVASVV